MKIYKGNCSLVIDCDLLISECLEHTVEPYTGNMDLDPTDLFYEDHLEQKQLAEIAGYTKGTSIEFRHYYPETHFDKEFVDKISEFIGVIPLISFVSEIRPGKCAPWHWDINPWLNDYPDGKINRYTCFINKPKPGHVFMIEQECFYWEDQGNIYQYPDLKSWHAGSNVGLENKYLFTLTGLQKN